MDNKQTELRVAILDFMDELCPIIISFYEKLRDLDLTEVGMLGDIAEALKHLAIHAANVNSKLNLGLDEEIAAISAQIAEMVAAVEGSDVLYLADVLEFDVVENMEKIYNAVRDA